MADIKLTVTIDEEEQNTRIVRSMKVITQTIFYRYFYSKIYTLVIGYIVIYCGLVALFFILKIKKNC